jgi:hypothetical protein
MNKIKIALVFTIGMFVGAVSATSLETGITKKGFISYLNQACAD